MLISSSADFAAGVRSKLLAYDRYHEEASDLEIRIPRISRKLTDAAWCSEHTLGEIQSAASSRAEYGLNLLTSNYSAGANTASLAQDFPKVVEYWEEFAERDRTFQQSPHHHGAIIAHASFLGDYGYFDALRLVCFAYLLGHTNLIPRIKAILDYGNPTRDCLIERLLQPFGLAVDPLPDDSTRELPYRNTIKIFNAAPADRPALMQRYLEKWYHASRREYYYDTHKGSATFLGYWSFESGVLTYLLDIDDSSYRDHEFYPKDMVDFARKLKAAGDLGSGGDAADKRRPNVPANQPCPEAGWWFTPAQANSRRYFKQGEIMPSVGGDYGETFWQWSPDQSAPTL